MENFSDRLRHARKQRNLTQAALARASGLSQRTISSYETGMRKSTTVLIQLAQALEVSPAWLTTGVGPMEAASDPNMPVELSQRKLQDVQLRAISVTWPFKSIRASDYWSLPEAQRRIIEQTVAAMITALHKEHDK